MPNTFFGTHYVSGTTLSTWHIIHLSVLISNIPMMFELLLSRCMETAGALTTARSPKVPEVVSGRAVVQSLSY